MCQSFLSMLEGAQGNHKLSVYYTENTSAAVKHTCAQEDITHIKPAGRQVFQTVNPRKFWERCRTVNDSEFCEWLFPWGNSVGSNASQMYLQQQGSRNNTILSSVFTSKAFLLKCFQSELAACNRKLEQNTPQQAHTTAKLCFFVLVNCLPAPDLGEQHPFNPLRRHKSFQLSWREVKGQGQLQNSTDGAQILCHARGHYGSIHACMWLQRLYTLPELTCWSHGWALM